MHPALSSVSSVYPPISPDVPHTVQNYLGDYYAPNPVSEPERLRALDSRMVWTAFYRRVSYEEGSDPNLYEVIAVAIRLSSASQRHPLFVPGSFAKATLQHVDDADGQDTGWPGTGGTSPPPPGGVDRYSFSSRVAAPDRGQAGTGIASPWGRGDGVPTNSPDAWRQAYHWTRGAAPGQLRLRGHDGADSVAGCVRVIAEAASASSLLSVPTAASITPIDYPTRTTSIHHRFTSRPTRPTQRLCHQAVS